MTINKFLFITAAAIGLVACEPNKNTTKNTNENGPYQCIAANITVGGKPMPVLIEWNAQTGVARFLDSAIFTSKSNGAQRTVVGWVPLGELNQVIQEVLKREQQQQQQHQKVVNAVTMPSGAAAPTPGAPAVETHAVKSNK